ncbi:MAG TPA: chemotaxis response regulator protein-glutamate methylesterase [Deltaproteobacteria bacterium]|nr:chemotaxis response regulator protein-glutamate methylesterase [Deltaproteobacteria bacterium]
MLKRMLSLSPDIEVVGTACNGKEALEMIPKLDPHVICADIHMPVMDGIKFTKEVMARHPMPILVISVSVKKDKPSSNVFNMLAAGAIDISPKPHAGTDAEIQESAVELARKVRILSGVKIIRRVKPSTELKKEIHLAPSTAKGRLGDLKPKIIVIGASTGGPVALQEVLRKLPEDFSLPVVCVQHISEGFLNGLVEWLSSQCKMKVEIARTGESPLTGTIYFPEEGRHLMFDKEGRFVSAEDMPYEGHRPSITVTFRSAVCYYGNAVLGVLLTGMGRDGAEGMLAVKEAGGITIAQDKETSIVFGMPKQAIDLGAAKYIASPDEIGEMLMQIRL